MDYNEEGPMSRDEALADLRNAVAQWGDNVVFIGIICDCCGLDLSIPADEIDELEERMEAHERLCPAHE